MVAGGWRGLVRDAGAGGDSPFVVLEGDEEEGLGAVAIGEGGGDGDVDAGATDLVGVDVVAGGGRPVLRGECGFVVGGLFVVGDGSDAYIDERVVGDGGAAGEVAGVPGIEVALDDGECGLFGGGGVFSFIEGVGAEAGKSVV